MLRFANMRRRVISGFGNRGEAKRKQGGVGDRGRGWEGEFWHTLSDVGMMVLACVEAAQAVIDVDALQVTQAYHLGGGQVGFIVTQKKERPCRTSPSRQQISLGCGCRNRRLREDEASHTTLDGRHIFTPHSGTPIPVLHIRTAHANRRGGMCRGRRRRAPCCGHAQ